MLETKFQDVHKLVKFRGKWYWWHKDMLSPRSHYDGSGNLLANPLRALSYAIITDDGKIMRHHVVIGTVDDLDIIDVGE